MSQNWTRANELHEELSSQADDLLSNWKSYEQTAEQLSVSLKLIEHENETYMEPVDSLEDKQSRIHEQRTLCFNLEELVSR